MMGKKQKKVRPMAALAKLQELRDRQNSLVERVTSSSAASSSAVSGPGNVWRLRKPGDQINVLPRLNFGCLRASSQHLPRQDSSEPDNLSSRTSSDDDDADATTREEHLEDAETARTNRRMESEYFEYGLASYQPRSAQAVLRTLEKNDELLRQLAASQQKLEEAEALIEKQKQKNTSDLLTFAKSRDSEDPAGNKTIPDNPPQDDISKSEPPGPLIFAAPDSADPRASAQDDASQAAEGETQVMTPLPSPPSQPQPKSKKFTAVFVPGMRTYSGSCAN